MKAELLKTDQSWVALITMGGRTFQMTLGYSKTEPEAQKVIDSLNTCFECERLLEQLIGGDEIKRMVDGYVTAQDIRKTILTEGQDIRHCKDWDNGKCVNKGGCGVKYCEFDRDGFLPQEERNCFYFN